MGGDPAECGQGGLVRAAVAAGAASPVTERPLILTKHDVEQAGNSAKTPIAPISGLGLDRVQAVADMPSRRFTAGVDIAA
ncbi:hypothetical protein GCM10009753_71540 [Streptantibioticus ferralitis]